MVTPEERAIWLLCWGNAGRIAMGYMTEERRLIQETTLHAVERYWRDARLTKIFEGTSEIQQRIISDHLLGKARA
jgi:alkylation response protein AidB-like acyl-CoA dehydrogenase